MTVLRTSPFGESLKRWRTLRRMSQLELGNLIRTPPRHVSFLETGRARPSRDMVHRLATALELPPDEQNALLLAAGFAPVFATRALSDEAMAAVQFVIDRLLTAHDPYPALVLDAWYDIVQLNTGARALLGALRGTADGAAPTVNLVELLLTELVPVIVNQRAVLREVQHRLRRDLARRPGDARLAALLERASAALPQEPDATPARHQGRRQARAHHEMPDDSPVLLTRFRTAAGELRTLSALVHFAGAHDVTVHGLQLELLYPADALTEAVLASLTAAASPADAGVQCANASRQGASSL